ncbi:MAG: S41 family peptidase [Candidatus Electrothrix sp. GW3-4]|uniref:S41 family peptidase n=1 Tax=Candidatus Electrothrix sp. GW3-4 TaxID=3126740 RepID=UPI0030D3E671
MKNFFLQLILLFFCLIFACPGYCEPPEADEGERDAETYNHLETFANVLDLLQKHYVDKVESGEVLIGAINGMLGSLDPHSSYMSPEDFKELQEDTKGSFSGIGIEVTVRDGVLTVVSPIAGTPAYRQGVKAGDQIVRINNISTQGMTLPDAVKILRGNQGEKVTVTIRRTGLNELLDMAFVRDIIPHHSVVAKKLGNGFHYIQVTSFQATTTRDFKKVLRKAGQEGVIQGIVLDLRNNPGGLLDQAVQLVDVFLESGVIVTTRGREKENDMYFEADRGKTRYTFPAVVLVNGGSASASEIVAGALQDHKRAVILGTRTFGKGSVQTVVPLPNGAGVRLTTARYYTPSGRSIQATGIVPDMIIPFEEEKITGQGGGSTALLREEDLPHHFENNSQGKNEGQVKKKKKNIQVPKGTAAEFADRLAGDNQLQVALFILKKMATSLHRH